MLIQLRVSRLASAAHLPTAKCGLEKTEFTQGYVLVIGDHNSHSLQHLDGLRHQYFLVNDLVVVTKVNESF